MNKKNYVTATWIWDLDSLEENYEDVISFVNEQGVNLIYLHVSLRSFDKVNFQSFIKRASEEDIEVYALGGDPNWALTKNQKSLNEFVSIVKGYNRQVTEEEMFQGIHVDIEPYLLPDWENNNDEIINQWINNIKHLTKQAKFGTELNISGDFPFWIDEVKIPGESQSVGEWMISKLDSITIMAYRDYTDGKNGIRWISSPLVEQAANHNKSVVVGVNVIKTSEGSHTTFYDTPPRVMEQELRLLKEHFSGHPGFGGIAVHDYSYWKSKLLK
ncbi:hypothetical protein [Aquibacillus albus]|uniref:Uncharacterized protein n=1 Tax=Aquibacillus albus TaxID=1168171 RepID=A0ABS2N509_9BACI|nr:hypothetical protein [Aquibacillus albus]MBM7572970.1 hypothetical protein [Aquibacillus albus]